MPRLSSQSSQHLQYVISGLIFPWSLSARKLTQVSQPYQTVGEAISDIPRQMHRESRKKIGLPASKDVGTLSKMIQSLEKEASAFVGQPISAATVSIPHLAALYGEDLYDAFEYLSLVYIKFFPFYNYRPIHSTISAYAGNGLGLCDDYANATSCDEQERQMESLFILSISYTHSSLTASQAHVVGTFHLQETPTVEDLSLGYDARHNNPSENFYWESVRDAIRSPIITSPIRRNVTKVLLSGDAAQIPTFRKILKEAVYEVIDGDPEIIDHDPVYSAARGTAELAKRATFDQRMRLNESDAVFEL